MVSSLASRVAAFAKRSSEALRPTNASSVTLKAKRNLFYVLMRSRRHFRAPAPFFFAPFAPGGGFGFGVGVGVAVGFGFGFAGAGAGAGAAGVTVDSSTGFFAFAVGFFAFAVGFFFFFFVSALNPSRYAS